MLNRKVHILQISHRVMNWYQNVIFGKCEIHMVDFDNFGGLKYVLKFGLSEKNCFDIAQMSRIVNSIFTKGSQQLGILVRFSLFREKREKHFFGNSQNM